MINKWMGIKLPRITYKCCGFTYDSFNPLNTDFFRCFAHKSSEKKVKDKEGALQDVKFCITFWLVCKNNECITSFTYYYNQKKEIISNKQAKGIKYILKLKDKFIENIPIKVKLPKLNIKSNNYLWKYTDRHPKKNFISNIYTLDDIKVGETLPQYPKIYKIQPE